MIGPSIREHAPATRPRSRYGVLATAGAITVLLAVSGLVVNASTKNAKNDAFEGERRRMVETQIQARGVDDARVLGAMEQVPRHLFVPEEMRTRSYGDHPLPIGWGQTISQPYIVALMCDLLELDGSEKILEIGTGSGYHAAVLSRLAGEVFSIEIVEQLGLQARDTLKELGYDNVKVRVGDGYLGWPAKAPFDGVILTAAPPTIPQPLVDQLKVGGIMVAPVGTFVQDLVVITKTDEGIHRRHVTGVRFVPMTGRIQEGED